MNSQFYKQISQAFAKALSGDFDDNFDEDLRPISSIEKIRFFMMKFLKLIMIVKKRESRIERNILILPNNNYYLENLEKFEFLFKTLSDNTSRSRVIELLAYRIFGPLHVKLSLNNNSFWLRRTQVNKCKLSKIIKMKSFRCDLSLFNLEAYGYDLQLFFTTNGIYVDFVLQQYNYDNLVCVENGDTVIDAGACWGDTALYFASCGAKAIYAYEFIPSNLEIFKKNIALNPRYIDQIHAIEAPVWSESDIALSYDDRGPASQVGSIEKYCGKTKTLSIDDLVQQRKLNTVNFIKMDIEGAEMAALKGAAETIKRFKPKLAISIYHKQDDMIVIPKYIISLNCNYELYLDYYTIVSHEIILYAIDKNNK